MTAAPTILFGLACGVDGAYVDVTADVLFEEGDVSFTEGRASEFDDIRPGSFSFTLANGDGKYTPDNLDTSLDTLFTEGMGAVLQIGDLLLSGTVRSLVLSFPPLEGETKARVRVTVDDMLSTASRRQFGDFYDLIASSTVPEVWWPLDDAVGSPAARFIGSASAGSVLSFPSGGATFGVAGVDVAGTPQLRLSGAVSAVGSWTGTASSIGFWLTFETFGDFAVTLDSGMTATVTVGVEGSSRFSYVQIVGGSRMYGPAIQVGVPYLFELVGGAAIPPSPGVIAARARVNGVTISQSTVAGSDLGGTNRSATVTLSSGTVLLSQMSDSSLPFETLMQSDAETRLEAIAAFTADTIAFDTFPTLSEVTYGAEPLEGQTALGALNDVIRAEQCYMWVETGGTPLSPDPKIKVGARDRERAIDYTFDVTELQDPIAFSRSLRTTVSQFTANGPDASAIYQDATLVPLVGAASSSDSLLIRDTIDLYAYASDRVSRGINHQIPILAITVEATSPQIDRWDDLCTIRQGHRIHLTGLPSTQLGYDTWDGYVVGRTIVNTQDSLGTPRTFFTFNLSPRLPVAVYDTARYSAGGTLALSGAINSSVTTFSVATSAAKLTTTPAHFPFDIQIDREVMTVTAATGATPQVFTVTRGTNPAAHDDGSNVDLANVAIVTTDRYAY